MSRIATEVSLDVAGKFASIGSTIQLGLAIAKVERRARRDAEVDSVTRLAYRLDDARADQAEAEERAAAAEARLAAMEMALSRSVAEADVLRHALAAEMELTAGLRDIIGH